MNEAHWDTKTRIVEAALHLFALNGFEGTPTREIAKRAQVNISALNYHFRSKQNLMDEIAGVACIKLKEKISSIAVNSNVGTTSEFALLLYDNLLTDNNRGLFELKLILAAKSFPPSFIVTLIGFNEFKIFLRRDLSPEVPESEYLYIAGVIYSFIGSSAFFSKTYLYKECEEKFLPLKQESSKIYLKKLVENLISGTNLIYKK